MKIVVLNGSPKGDVSVTMQYVHFIQNRFPDHELKILNIAQPIKRIERDPAAFQAVLDEVRAADGVLWAFPLYVMLVHAHYKRFIELVFERHAEAAFRGKYSAILTTSIKFFDHTAHNYVHAVCDDLSMKHVGVFSAHMEDLHKEAERQRLVLFAEDYFDAIRNHRPTPRVYPPIVWSPVEYTPAAPADRVNAGDKRVVIVTDAQSDQANLLHMIERFRASFSAPVDVINLNHLDIKGGCLGCIRCGYDNHCVYEGKDDFIEFYTTKVMAADIVIFAGAIKNRYLSAAWKRCFDRRFFMTHQPTLRGKQVGYIISGPLAQIANLRQILTGMADLEQANLAGIVTDEPRDALEIDAQLQALAAAMVRGAERGYVGPSTFLAVGGMKIFRDSMWGHLRVAFRADHLDYKRRGVYDFPQYDYRTRLQNAVFAVLLRIPRIRQEFQKRIRTAMIAPFKKIVANAARGV